MRAIGRVRHGGLTGLVLRGGRIRRVINRAGNLQIHLVGVHFSPLDGGSPVAKLVVKLWPRRMVWGIGGILNCLGISCLPAQSFTLRPPLVASFFFHSYCPITFNLFSRRFFHKKRLTMRQMIFAWLALIAAVFRCVRSRCLSSVACMRLNGQGCIMLLWLLLLWLWLLLLYVYGALS
jgi:hypothetical protein